MQAMETCSSPVCVCLLWGTPGPADLQGGTRRSHGCPQKGFRGEMGT